MTVNELIQGANMNDVHFIFRKRESGRMETIGGGHGRSCCARYGHYEIERCWIVDSLLMVHVKDN